jgi:hypothetical protein
MKIFQVMNNFKLLKNKLSTFQWTEMYVNENPVASKVNYICVKLSYLDFKFNITSVVHLCNNITLKSNVCVILLLPLFTYISVHWNVLNLFFSNLKLFMTWNIFIFYWRPSYFNYFCSSLYFSCANIRKK